MNNYLEFEKPIEEIDNKIKSLQQSETGEFKTIKNYQDKKKILFEKIYTQLTPWQKVQVARHPDRPHTADYIKNIFQDFLPLAGDRKFSDDKAIVGGIAKIDNISTMIVGTEKGNSMESRLKHNFGMAKPEGYRKVQRLFFLAEKFNLPIITFVDTAGAFPGKEAEERGQSESIASSIVTCLKVKTPILSIIIGEGGSGGAIALATADDVMMLENSIYSVISPEGCASILWRDSEAVQKAADSLKLTADECLRLKVINSIIPEKYGGAHRYKTEQFQIVKKFIIEKISELKKISIEDLNRLRNEKFLNITQN
jgi:acetyl-CoA carboxylase carboxyl transferase subunit alpha